MVADAPGKNARFLMRLAAHGILDGFARLDETGETGVHARREMMAAAEQAAAEEAAKAREVYQEAIDAGWTGTELTSAGLKPPAPPRKRGSSSDAEPAAAVS